MFYTKFNRDEVWITSDIHAYHKNICSGTSSWKSGYRNFENPEIMTDTIVNNINDIVPKKHHLIIVGDILFGKKTNLPSFVSRINCENIYLVFGNHDKFIWENYEYQKLFKWTGHALEVNLGDKLVCFNHYAYRVWNDSHRGSWMLYGHSHGGLPDNLNAKSIDIGMDTEYSIFNNQLVMTTNYDLQPIEHENGFVNKIDMSLYNNWNKRNIIHKRFTPFSYHELEEIMCYKKQEIVDHHKE